MVRLGHGIEELVEAGVPANILGRGMRSASDGHAASLVNDQRQAAIELAI